MGKKKGRQQQSSNTPITTDSAESIETETNNSQASVKITCQHIAKSVEQNHVKKNINLENLWKPICTTCTRQGKEPVLGEESWFCLRCGSRACSLKHSQDHHEVPHSDLHSLALKIPSFTAWCHACKVDIPEDSNKKLKQCINTLRDMYEKTQNQAQKMEFGTSPAEPAAGHEGENMSIFKKKNFPCKTGRPPPSVRGLTNLGNTCFFNSVLQCLARTPNIVEVLKEMQAPPHRVDIILASGKRIEGDLDAGDRLGESLAATLEQLRGGGQPFSPGCLLGLLRKKCPQFQGYDQHDAHELLRHLLDAVRTQDLRRYKKLVLNQTGLSSKVNPDEVSEEMKKELKTLAFELMEKVTLVPEQVFRGFLVSTLQCQECSSKSHCIESFLDLSLPVMSEKGMVGIPCRKNSGVAAGSGGAIAVEEKGGAPISKHQLKKERRMSKKKGRKHGAGGGNSYKEETQTEQPAAHTPQSKAGDGDSTDVTGEIMVADDKKQQESGYSSEKVGAGSVCGSSGGGSDSARASPSSITEEIVTIATIPAPGLFLCEGVPPITDVPDYLKYRIGMGFKWSKEQDSSERAKFGLNNLVVERPEFGSFWKGGLGGGRVVMEGPMNLETMKLGMGESSCVRGGTGPPPFRDGLSILKDDPNWRQRLDKFGKLFPDNFEPQSDLQKHEGKCSLRPSGNLSVIKEDEDPPMSPDISAEETLVKVAEISESLLSRIRHLLKPGEESSGDEGLNLGRLYEVPEEDEEEETMQIEPLCGECQPRPPPEPITVGDIASASSIADRGVEDEETEETLQELKVIEECSVEGCLKQFTSVEQMTGSNMVGCKQCSENSEEKKTVYTKSTKQLLIKQVPPVLILHLKRFQLQMYSFRKLSRHVSFPLTLDLAPYCLPESVQEISANVPYSLYGVVEHSGTFNGGHYVAYVKVESENDSRWYCISDSHVNEVTESRVLNSQAYLLFYKQIPS